MIENRFGGYDVKVHTPRVGPLLVKTGPLLATIGVEGPDAVGSPLTTIGVKRPDADEM